VASISGALKWGIIVSPAVDQQSFSYGLGLETVGSKFVLRSFDSDCAYLEDGVKLGERFASGFH
jgi:hypothetical protein